MSKGAESQRLTPEERANLVAYLDDELNDAESRAIATKLTQSVSARREVECLERTWQLLEELPMPKASESLTQRTLIEAEKLDLAGHKVLQSASKTARRIMTALLWTVASAACFFVGLVVVRWVIPDPTARLARDLTIAEHYQAYKEVDTFEFLKRLDDSPAFANDPN